MVPAGGNQSWACFPSPCSSQCLCPHGPGKPGHSQQEGGTGHLLSFFMGHPTVLALLPALLERPEPSPTGTLSCLPIIVHQQRQAPIVPSCFPKAGEDQEEKLEEEGRGEVQGFAVGSHPMGSHHISPVIPLMSPRSCKTLGSSQTTLAPRSPHCCPSATSCTP